MEDFPSNSILKTKTTKKPQGKIIKEPLLIKVFSSIDFNKLGQELVFDILIPELKKILLSLIESVLYGESGSSASKRRFQRYGDRSFIAYSNVPYTGSRRRVSRQTDRHNFTNVYFDSRGEAENLLEILLELIDNYGQATVEDFYEGANLETQFVDRKFGWRQLGGAHIRLSKDGYILELPRPIELD